MSKIFTVDEWLFALGIYPSMNAIDKYSLFIEMLELNTEAFSKDEFYNKVNLGNDTKQIKKLSQKKKASFTSFLNSISIEDEVQKYQEQKISWVHLLSKDYPNDLREIFAPPVVLFYRGQLDFIEKHMWLGVVGARACTDYGLKAVEKIVPNLLEHTAYQVGIISGLAKGIDTKAHQEAIKAHGHTIGVIGTGLDVFYPNNNRELQEMMAKRELVISEYPLGTKPLKFHFPERNRIIAGLSRGILVIEAKQRSGSLITAYNALDENRDVFAVPGSIFESKREGCHRLIKLGAVLTQGYEDILQEWFIL